MIFMLILRVLVLFQVSNDEVLELFRALLKMFIQIHLRIILQKLIQFWNRSFKLVRYLQLLYNALYFSIHIV